MRVGLRYGRRGNDLLVPQMVEMVAAISIGLGSVPQALLRKVRKSTGEADMILRQFLFDNFGWDIYDWGDDELRF